MIDDAALYQKLALDNAGTDPTDLQCKVCRSFYPLNSPRVVRALKYPKGERETPDLCWVCARLHVAAHQEATS